MAIFSPLVYGVYEFDRPHVFNQRYWTDAEKAAAQKITEKYVAMSIEQRLRYGRDQIMADWQDLTR